MKATRQFMSLCLVIGMTIVGNSTVLAQGADLARTTSLINNPSSYSSQNEIRELTVGDKVPDVTFNSLLYYPTQVGSLSAFKDKLIILDFWSSWCGACINLIPHMDSLQKKFGDQIQVVLVNVRSKANGDDEAKIRKIIERVKKRTGQAINLPVVYNCDELDTYFPAKFLPHEVWIDGNGKVAAITSSFEVTEANIQHYLDNGTIKLRTKKDDFNYSFKKPLSVDSNQSDASFIKYRSVITGFKEGLAGISVRANPENPQEIIGYSLMNKPLSTLLEIAYAGELTGFAENRRRVDIKHKELIADHDADSLRYKFLYCYDIILPPTSREKLNKFIQQDIERYFNTSVKKEKQKLKCFVLKSTKKVASSFSKFEKPDADTERSSLNKYLHRYTLSELIDFFDHMLDMPLIDETNLDRDLKFDIQLPFDLKDKKQMIHALELAGFQILQEEREVEIAIITDK